MVFPIILDLIPPLLVDVHFHVFLLLSGDLEGIQTGVKGQIVLEFAIPLSAYQHTLDHNIVARRSLLDQVASHLDREVLRDLALFELIRCLLDFQVLVGQELGVAGQEGQLAIHIVLLADCRLALDHRPELLVVDFKVVLATAAVACIGAHHQFWLDLGNPDHDCLADY